MRRPETAPLAAAVVLSLACVVCALAHVAAPDFLPYAIVALLGIAIPTPGTAQTAVDTPAQPTAPAQPVAAVSGALSDAYMPTPKVAPAAIIPGPAA